MGQAEEICVERCASPATNLSLGSSGGISFVRIIARDAVAAALSSIPVRASGPNRSVNANGLAGAVNFVDTSNPADTVMGNVQVSRVSNTTYFLKYFINDAAGMINDSSFGSIPASSVSVSGGAVTSGKTVLTLNVNTCDFPDLIANGQGPLRNVQSYLDRTACELWLVLFAK